MITFVQKGDFSKTESFLERAKELFGAGDLDRYGKMGVNALSDATPQDTGLASESWSYEIVRSKGCTKIVWTNDDVEGGCNVAVLLQYGHGTKDGAYVEGIDYVNPAMRKVFRNIADEMWEEVTR